MKTELQERADILSSNLQRSIDACFEVLRSVNQLFSSTQRVDWQEFQRFVQPALSRHPAIQALEWLPRLRDRDRASFERTLQQSGFPNFRITEQAPDGSIVPAAQRAEYFPVCFAEPLAVNQLALGFDLSSNAVRRRALEKAKDTGEIVLSQRIELVQGEKDASGLLVVLPIYQSGVECKTAQLRQTYLRGFVLGVFRLTDIVQAALTGLNLEHINVYLYDKSNPLGRSFLAVYDAPNRRIVTEFNNASAEPNLHPNGSLRSISCTRNFEIADRQWSLMLAPTTGYIDRDTLYQQSQIRAEAATAEAKKLRSVLRNLQQTQARWFVEKRLIAIGVGLVLMILTGANLFAYGNLTQLAEARSQLSTADGGTEIYPLNQSRIEPAKAPASTAPAVALPLSLWEQQANAIVQQTFMVNVISIVLSLGLMVGVYYLLQRQMHERHEIESALLEANSQLEQEVQQRMEELERTREISDLKLRLFSMVSHEFRTPLSTILLSTQMLETGSEWADEKKTKSLSRIHTAAKTMAQLLNDILTLNRAEAGKLEFRTEEIDLNAFCHRIVDEIQVSILQPIVFLSENTSYFARVDSKLLHSILSNLLSNAAKYSGSDSPIYFRLIQLPNAVQFQIQDSGIGIPPDDQQKLYELFHRGKNVGEIVGTGLGLSVVKTCVDLHSGTVHVESEVGKGTTFTVVLPQ